MLKLIMADVVVVLKYIRNPGKSTVLQPDLFCGSLLAALILMTLDSPANLFQKVMCLSCLVCIQPL